MLAKVCFIVGLKHSFYPVYGFTVGLCFKMWSLYQQCGRHGGACGKGRVSSLPPSTTESKSVVLQDSLVIRVQTKFESSGLHSLFFLHKLPLTTPQFIAFNPLVLRKTLMTYERH